MKISRLTLLASAILPLAAMGQSAVDGLQMNRNDLRGTARFMSMGGAFTALGGDLSTLTQNPGGIGIYRSNEVGVTMDIDIMSSKSETQGYKMTNDMTKVYCPNFGYIGTWRTGNEILPFFNWGVSYGRARSLDRRYQGYVDQLGGSLTNHMATYLTGQGFTSAELSSGSTAHNPYDYDYSWLGVLLFNGGEINPISNRPTNNMYQGLYTPGCSSANASYFVEEKGYIDEYSINFGGNFINQIYWGLGIGITDIDFKQWTTYGEGIDNGMMPYDDGTAMKVANGNGAFALDSYKHIWGNGVNVKFGMIFKPINEFRIGFAIHTPTWYSLTETTYGSVDGSFEAQTSGPLGATQQHPYKFSTYTNNGYDSWVDWEYRTPWRLMLGAAGVIGQKAIISLDYEYNPYNQMHFQSNNGVDFALQNEDAKNYFQATNTLRLGLEYRVTPSFSLRAGYSYVSSPVKGESKVNELNHSDLSMATGGAYDYNTDASFTLDNDTNYITCGLGYRYQMFYVDAAYVYRHTSSTYYPWTDSKETSKLTFNDHNIVLSCGLKF